MVDLLIAYSLFVPLTLNMPLGVSMTKSHSLIVRCSALGSALQLCNCKEYSRHKQWFILLSNYFLANFESQSACVLKFLQHSMLKFLKWYPKIRVFLTLSVVGHSSVMKHNPMKTRCAGNETHNLSPISLCLLNWDCMSHREHVTLHCDFNAKGVKLSDGRTLAWILPMLKIGPMGKQKHIMCDFLFSIWIYNEFDLIFKCGPDSLFYFSVLKKWLKSDL